MKTLALAAGTIICLSVLAVGGFASAEPTTMPTTAPTIANKLCPVTKDPVDSKVPTVEYDGKTIGFCCDDCVKEFKSNPEKYMKDLK